MGVIKNSYMRVLFLVLYLALGVSTVHAYVPNVVEQKSLLDITEIKNPTLKQTFYGQLLGFPHTYEIVVIQPLLLRVQINVPNFDTNSNILSGIIIKEPKGKGRVEEIVRLSAKDAAWNTEHEWWTLDSYRAGPIFEKELAPGTYRLEVNTPDNVEKYVLVVGTEDDMALGYFETIQRIANVKAFFEKSQLRVIESPLVSVPLFAIGVAYALWRRTRKQRAAILPL